MAASNSDFPLPGETAPARSARMLRVDHAGEIAAKRIYQGQLAVLKQQPRAHHSTALIAEMAGKEAAHLAAFDRLILQRGVRPTALTPVWDIVSYGLGVASALLGERAAMACTAFGMLLAAVTRTAILACGWPSPRQKKPTCPAIP